MDPGCKYKENRPSTAVLIMLCMSVIFFSSSSICACTRRIPTEFSVTVSATSVEIPATYTTYTHTHIR